VLLLAVLGLFAAPVPADTSVRIPGTTLRFGLTDSTVSARGYAVVESGTRQGRCRFFGLDSEARLDLEGGRLREAQFTVTGASAYEIAYVTDQLTAMGYRRRCEPAAPRASRCDWTGRTRVLLETQGTIFSATVRPPGADAPAARAVSTGAPAVSAEAARRALARLMGADAAARAPAPAAPTSVPDAGAARAASSPAPVSPPARASGDSVGGPSTVPGPVPVLPETLAVPAAGRTSRYAPATVLERPRCGYPEVARAAGVQGRVWILALVDADGRVLRAQVTQGIPVLDAAALRCVRDWTFRPVSWRGAPCRFWAVVPVTFTSD